MKILTFILVVIWSMHSHAKTNYQVETFFKDSEYRGVSLSPTGEYLAVRFDDGDEVKLAIIDREKNKIISSYAYGDNKRVNGITWLNDTRLLMEVQKFVGYLDTKGERPFYVATNVDGSKRIELLHSNTSLVRIISILPNDPKHILISKGHGLDKLSAKIHKLNIYNGREDYISGQPKADVFGIAADLSGNPRLAFNYEEKDEDEFSKGTLSIYYKKTPKSKWKALELKDINYSPGDSLNPLGFNEAGTELYISSDSKSKTSNIYKFDFKTAKFSMLIEDDSVDINTERYGRGHLGSKGELIGITYMPNYPKTEYFDENNKDVKLHRSLRSIFKYKKVTVTNYTKDRKTALVVTSSDKDPGTFYLFDIEKNKIKKLASVYPQIDEKKMQDMEPYQIKARDGVVLNGYLTLPKGESTNLPTIMMLHGGPHGPRDNWGFHPEVQFLSSLGYAVVQVNFRGSGGYGKDFLESGYKKWGREMQDDVTDATHWAIKEKIADPDRICIYGGSYGGYTTLMGVVREPDLYKCALGYVGVYDLPEMFKSGDSPTTKGGRRFLKAIHGEDIEDMKARSPAHNVDKIKAALFIAHGEDDIRVPMEQYESLTTALDEINYPYESMLRDEGHGYQKEVNKFAFYNKMADFFQKHLAEK